MSEPVSNGAFPNSPNPPGQGRGFWRVPGRLEMLFFFLHPFVLGCWIVRIADVQYILGLSKAQFATVLLGFPVGSLIVLLPSTWILSRLGLRRSWMLGFVVYSISFVLMGQANSLVTLGIAFGLIGASLLLTQLAMNIQVNCVERDEKVLVMSRCHGFFMVGLLTGCMIGVGLDVAGFEPGPSLAFCSLLGLVPGVITISHVSMRRMQNPGNTRLGLPPLALIPILLYLLGNTMTEGVLGAWSTIYLDEVFGEPHDISGLGFALFTATFAIGRLFGDYAKGFGTVKVARIFCTLGIASLALMAAAPNPATVFAALAICGIGIAFGFPYTMSAAAKIGGDATLNATYVMFTAVMCFQIGPVIFGYAAALSSLPVALGLLIPVMLVSFFAAGRLRA